MPLRPDPEAPAVSQEGLHDEDREDRCDRADEEAAQDVGDVVDVRCDASGADCGREEQEPGGQATTPGQEGRRDRRGEGRVVRREPVVRGVRDERCMAVDDEGARVRPEVCADLDADDGQHDGQHPDTSEGDLLCPRHLQPDECSSDRDEEDGIGGHGDDQGVHAGSVPSAAGGRLGVRWIEAGALLAILARLVHDAQTRLDSWSIRDVARAV
jgi:hypothetical protein